MWGETPVGSPEGDFPVTKRKLPMLIAARSTPVGASSDTTSRGIGMCPGMGEFPQLILNAATSHEIFALERRARRSARLRQSVLLKDRIKHLQEWAHAPGFPLCAGKTRTG